MSVSRARRVLPERTDPIAEIADLLARGFLRKLEVVESEDKARNPTVFRSEIPPIFLEE